MPDFSRTVRSSISARSASNLSPAVEESQSKVGKLLSIGHSIVEAKFDALTHLNQEPKRTIDSKPLARRKVSLNRDPTPAVMARLPKNNPSLKATLQAQVDYLLHEVGVGNSFPFLLEQNPTLPTPSTQELEQLELHCLEVIKKAETLLQTDAIQLSEGGDPQKKYSFVNDYRLKTQQLNGIKERIEKTNALSAHARASRITLAGPCLNGMLLTGRIITSMMATAFQTHLIPRRDPYLPHPYEKKAQAHSQASAFNPRVFSLSEQKTPFAELADLREAFYEKMHRKIGRFPAYQDYYYFTVPAQLDSFPLNKEQPLDGLDIDPSPKLTAKSFNHRIQSHLAYEKTIQASKAKTIYLRNGYPSKKYPQINETLFRLLQNAEVFELAMAQAKPDDRKRLKALYLESTLHRLGTSFIATKSNQLKLKKQAFELTEQLRNLSTQAQKNETTHELPSQEGQYRIKELEAKLEVLKQGTVSEAISSMQSALARDYGNALNPNLATLPANFYRTQQTGAFCQTHAWNHYLGGNWVSPELLHVLLHQNQNPSLFLVTDHENAHKQAIGDGLQQVLAQEKVHIEAYLKKKLSSEPESVQRQKIQELLNQFDALLGYCQLTTVTYRHPNADSDTRWGHMVSQGLKWIGQTLNPLNQQASASAEYRLSYEQRAEVERLAKGILDSDADRMLMSNADGHVFAIRRNAPGSSQWTILDSFKPSFSYPLDKFLLYTAEKEGRLDLQVPLSALKKSLKGPLSSVQHQVKVKKIANLETLGTASYAERITKF